MTSPRTKNAAKSRFDFSTIDYTLLSDYETNETDTNEVIKAFSELRIDESRDAKVKGNMYKSETTFSIDELDNETIFKKSRSKRKLYDLSQHYMKCVPQGENAVRVLPGVVEMCVATMSHSLCCSPFIRHCLLGTKCNISHQQRKTFTFPSFFRKIVESILKEQLEGKVLCDIPIEGRKYIKTLKGFPSATKFVKVLHGFLHCVIANQAAMSEPEDAIAIATLCVERIEGVFRGFQLETCHGGVFISPPGMGKTHFQARHPYGFIDTDDLHVENIDKSPDIVERLSVAGFAVLSNRHEWKKYKLMSIAIFPADLKKCLQSANIFPSRRATKSDDATTSNMSASERKEFFSKHKTTRKKSPANTSSEQSKKQIRYDQESWLDAYSDLKTSKNVMYIEAKNFTSGFATFLDAMRLGD